MLRHLAGRFHNVIFTRYLNNPRSVPPEDLEEKGSELLSSPLPTSLRLVPGEGPGGEGCREVRQGDHETHSRKPRLKAFPSERGD